MRYRALAVMICLVVVVPVIFSGGGAAQAEPALNGSGTVNDPYKITEASELQEISSDLDANYILVDNLDATAIEGFEPIGETGSPFTGTFDGNNSTIT